MQELEFQGFHELFLLCNKQCTTGLLQYGVPGHPGAQWTVWFWVLVHTGALP